MAGYKKFVAGGEALADDVNGYLLDQTVARFPSAANRTTSLPSPALNQLSMLDTRPGIVSYWNGSAWTDLAPFIQTGQTVGATDANGDIGTTFPLPFAGNPAVFFQIGSISAGNLAVVIARVYASNPNGCTVRCMYGAGVFANQNVTMYWLAIGVKP